MSDSSIITSMIQASASMKPHNTITGVEEEILQENPYRFTLLPVQKPALYKHYKNHIAVFWHVDEVDLSKDMKDWERLTEGEQHFIKHVLAFFAGSDGIVMENLASRFMREVQLPEARSYYAIQMAIEAIHSEMYALLIDTYITESDEKLRLFRAIENTPAIKEKAEWAQRWIDSPDASFATRLVGFAAVEGIFFSGSFCAIFWLKKRGLMPGLTFSNELISRDEGMHTDFACLLYKHLNNKISNEKIIEIVDHAVQIELAFVSESLPVELIGMNSRLMG